MKSEKLGYEPEFDAPEILATLAGIREDSPNPEVRTLAKLVADLCLRIVDLEEEIEVLHPPNRGA